MKSILLLYKSTNRYVTAVVDANNVTVEFPYATIATNGTGGIAQYLTNRSNPSVELHSLV